MKFYLKTMTIIFMLATLNFTSCNTSVEPDTFLKDYYHIIFDASGDFYEKEVYDTAEGTKIVYFQQISFIIKKGETINLDDVKYRPKNSGWKFKCWVLDPEDKEGKTKVEGIFLPESNIIFYAKWEALKQE